MNYKELAAAVQRIFEKSDELGIELEKKFDKRQKEYEQTLKNQIVSHEEMNKPFDH